MRRARRTPARCSITTPPPTWRATGTCCATLTGFLDLCGSAPATACAFSAGTILLVGNAGDPSTPYQDSVALSHELADARLLTVDGYGHTEASNPSTCADNYLINYALTGALPPAGTVCQENSTPFP